VSGDVRPPKRIPVQMPTPARSHSGRRQLPCYHSRSRSWAPDIPDALRPRSRARCIRSWSGWSTVGWSRRADGTSGGLPTCD